MCHLIHSFTGLVKGKGMPGGERGLERFALWLEVFVVVG